MRSDNFIHKKSSNSSHTEYDKYLYLMIPVIMIYTEAFQFFIIKMTHMYFSELAYGII